MRTTGVLLCSICWCQVESDRRKSKVRFHRPTSETGEESQNRPHSRINGTASPRVSTGVAETRFSEASAVRFRHRTETERDLACHILGDAGQKRQMTAARTGLSRHAKGVRTGIVRTPGSLVLIENALVGVLEQLLLANVQ